jgi:hypothetical protein
VQNSNAEKTNTTPTIAEKKQYISGSHIPFICILNIAKREQTKE